MSAIFNEMLISCAQRRRTTLRNRPKLSVTGRFIFARDQLRNHRGSFVGAAMIWTEGFSGFCITIISNKLLKDTHVFVSLFCKPIHADCMYLSPCPDLSLIIKLEGGAFRMHCHLQCFCRRRSFSYLNFRGRIYLQCQPHKVVLSPFIAFLLLLLSYRLWLGPFLHNKLCWPVHQQQWVKISVSYMPCSVCSSSLYCIWSSVIYGHYVW